VTCPRCGRQPAAGARFCGYCGAELAVQEAGTERIAAQIAPVRVPVAAGSEAGAEVQIRNLGSVVEHVSLSVVGDAAAWSTIDPPSLRIMPGASATAAVVLRPPRTSATVAGSHALIVQAAPVDNPGVAGQANAIVDVAPFTMIAARVVPRQATRWRGSLRTLELENDGNAPVGLRLVARDDDDAMRFEGLPPEATVAWGAPVRLRFRAATKRWRWFGRKPLPREFSVTGEGADGTQVVAPGVLLQRGVFNLFTGLIGILVLVIGIGLLLAVLLILNLLVQ
jgi:hypothetical protein